MNGDLKREQNNMDKILNILSDKLLSNNWKDYELLRDRLRNATDAGDLSSLADAVRSKEEEIRNILGDKSRAESMRRMYSKKGREADVKEERDKQMSLRRVLDSIYGR